MLPREHSLPSKNVHLQITKPWNQRVTLGNKGSLLSYKIIIPLGGGTDHQSIQFVHWRVQISSHNHLSQLANAQPAFNIIHRPMPSHAGQPSKPSYTNAQPLW